MQLATLSPGLVRNDLCGLTTPDGQPHTNRSKRDVLRLICALFHFARKRGFITRELADEIGEIDTPKSETVDTGIFTTSQIRTLLHASPGDLRASLMDDKGGSVLVITKLIEGNYLNYRQVIPGEMKERVPFSREELLHSLKRAEIMTIEKANSVKLTFGRNTLAITANSPEVGEARESLAINYKGKEFAVAFNPKYVIDPLAALTDDEAYLELI